MAQRRKCPFTRRIAKELGIRFRGGTAIQGAEPETARTRHPELTAHRIPAMSETYTHAQVAAQKRSRQGAGSILRTRDLVGMTGVQIPRGKTTCQRNRSN